MKKKLISLLMAATMLGTVLSGCGNAENQETDGSDLAAATGNSEQQQDGQTENVTLTVGYPTRFVPDAFNEVVKLAEEKIGIKIVPQPFSDADETTLRSLLASGEAPDLIFYNSGSLLRRLNPSKYFADISSYDSLTGRLEENFKESVTMDGVVYGIPQSASMGGGILYNKKMYEKYNLEVPKTWEDFINNCNTLSEAGETAVIGTFGSSWTSQLVFLADYYNITADSPNFSKEFEEGTAKYATTPIAVRSFEKYEDLVSFYNEDCAVATYDDG